MRQQLRTQQHRLEPASGQRRAQGCVETCWAGNRQHMTAAWVSIRVLQSSMFWKVVMCPWKQWNATVAPAVAAPKAAASTATSRASRWQVRPGARPAQRSALARRQGSKGQKRGRMCAPKTRACGTNGRLAPSRFVVRGCHCGTRQSRATRSAHPNLTALAKHAPKGPLNRMYKAGANTCWWS